MNDHAITFTLPNIEKDLNEIFDCQIKIKSLTSALCAIKAEMALLEHFINVIEQTAKKS